MKLTKEMIEDLKTKAEAFSFEYDAIGIRFQEVPFSIGKMDHVSHVWDDGDDTGEELNGVCAIKYTKLAEVMRYGVEYPGDHIAIIGSDYCEGGEDIGEIIIRDAEVLEIIK